MYDAILYQAFWVQGTTVHRLFLTLTLEMGRRMASSMESELIKANEDVMSNI